MLLPIFITTALAVLPGTFGSPLVKRTISSVDADIRTLESAVTNTQAFCEAWQDELVIPPN